jgi:3-hydroxyisobutyrate dehydrogenase
MKIGWLGTGIMGAPMARHVAAAGNDVVAWNRTREKAQGIEAAAVEGAEIVVTMLSDGAAVEEVAGQAGIPADAIWWQASTVGLEATARLKDIGPTYVDAPVLGTKQPAQEGTLTVLAAGPSDALDTLAPLFDAVGSKTIRLGEVGEATRAKLVMNHWVLALTAATAETISLAHSLGVDPSLFLEGIAGGPLDSAYAQMKGALILEDRTGEASFPLRLAEKDARLIVETGVAGELASAVQRAFARGAEAGLGDHDMAAVGEVSEASARRS